jgi:hypothetical protein
MDRPSFNVRPDFFLQISFGHHLVHQVKPFSFITQKKAVLFALVSTFSKILYCSMQFPEFFWSAGSWRKKWWCRCTVPHYSQGSGHGHERGQYRDKDIDADTPGRTGTGTGTSTVTWTWTWIRTLTGTRADTQGMNTDRDTGHKHGQLEPWHAPRVLYGELAYCYHHMSQRRTIQPYNFQANIIWRDGPMKPKVLEYDSSLTLVDTGRLSRELRATPGECLTNRKKAE